MKLRILAICVGIGVTLTALCGCSPKETDTKTEPLQPTEKVYEGAVAEIPAVRGFSLDATQKLYGTATEVVLHDVEQDMYAEPLNIEVSQELCKQFAEMYNDGAGLTEVKPADVKTVYPMQYALDLCDSTGVWLDTLQVSEQYVVSEALRWYARTDELNNWLSAVETEYKLTAENTYLKQPSDRYFEGVRNTYRGYVCTATGEEYPMSQANIKDLTKVLADVSFDNKAVDIQALRKDSKYTVKLHNSSEVQHYTLYVTDDGLYTEWGYKVTNADVLSFVLGMADTCVKAVG